MCKRCSDGRRCKEINVICVDSLSEGQSMQKCASVCPLKDHNGPTFLQCVWSSNNRILSKLLFSNGNTAVGEGGRGELCRGIMHSVLLFQSWVFVSFCNSLFSKVALLRTRCYFHTTLYESPPLLLTRYLNLWWRDSTGNKRLRAPSMKRTVQVSGR
jgi:hypothetical protein